LRTNDERGTKDSDVFDTVDLAEDTKQRLLQLAGARLRLVADDRAHCALADKLETYIKNLNEVERDMLWPPQ
jgi:hypothetical protein